MLRCALGKRSILLPWGREAFITFYTRSDGAALQRNSKKKLKKGALLEYVFRYCFIGKYQLPYRYIKFNNHITDWVGDNALIPYNLTVS